MNVGTASIAGPTHDTMLPSQTQSSQPVNADVKFSKFRKIMETFILRVFIFACISHISSGYCVLEQKTLICTNEFEFDGLYSHVIELQLVNSFISRHSLQSKFANLEIITVLGSYSHEQCSVLANLGYQVYGCSGNLLHHSTDAIVNNEQCEADLLP